MQAIYRSEPDGRLSETDEIVDGSWISLIDPTPGESAAVAKQCGIDPDDLRAALDVEERSRVTSEEGYVLVLVDVPTQEPRAGRQWYVTIPLGIVITDHVIITVCLEHVPLIGEFETGRIRDWRTFMKTRFTLQLLLRNARAYLSALRVIDKMIDRQEARLRRSASNAELIEMLELEKSLVYLNTSLISNQRVLDRLVRTSALKKYPEDEDLLEDTIIENEQAMEMAGIYSGILSGMMDAYASVIANNQNAIMKTLALVTIVMAIPNLVFSAYGMNVAGEGMPLAASRWGFMIVIVSAVLVAVIAGLALTRSRLFDWSSPLDRRSRRRLPD
ncbi:MAG: magnesium transporter CorA family protein [Propionibacteriaceae bacterium]|nr:magnesium transporter CorA family protein [Propionibacteriaceae bacterium]